jgi:predicted RNase H-like nuclease (RuvC/YqgF family)
MEVALYEKKLQKVKSVSDATAKQLFDAVNRGRKLAQSLGFDDVYDAQFAIDSMDHDISFRECYDRFHKQDDQLSARKEEVTALETKLRDAEEKVKKLQTESERYKVDFKKSRAFNDWLFAEDAKHNKYRKEPGITPEEKKQRDMVSVMRKKQMMVEIGPTSLGLKESPEMATGVRYWC